METLRWTVPILTAALAASLAAGYAQGGFVFAPEALSIKPDRFSPAAKLKQLFSLTGLSTTLKSLLPFSAICWVGYACIGAHWGEILSSSYSDSRSFVHLVSGMLLEVCWKSGAGPGCMGRRGLSAALAEERGRPEDEPPGDHAKR